VSVVSGSASASPGTGAITGSEPVAMIAVRQRSSRPCASIRPGAMNRPADSITSTPATRSRSGESCGSIVRIARHA
jgi:hypothetical protein